MSTRAIAYCLPLLIAAAGQTAAQIPSWSVDTFHAPPDPRWALITTRDADAAYALLRDNHPGAAAFIAVLLGSAAIGAVLGAGWRASLFTTLALVCAGASIAVHRLGQRSPACHAGSCGDRAAAVADRRPPI